VSAIIQYWHSEEIPEDVATLIETFREHNPDMRHLLFNEASATELIAENFTPREEAAFQACAIPSVQSDFLRYSAVLTLGGIYVDADTRCIAPISPLLQAAEAGTLFGWPELPPAFRTPLYEWRERVGPFRAVPCNLFGFRSPGHPLLELALEITTANIENQISENAALATGPGIFTSLYLLRELGSIDAFTDYVRGGALEPLAPLLCEVVGDYARIDRAFADVRVAPMSEAGEWVGPPGIPLAYKHTDTHWINTKSSIYR
jgi:hypothetical protein